MPIPQTWTKLLELLHDPNHSAYDIQLFYTAVNAKETGFAAT